MQPKEMDAFFIQCLEKYLQEKKDAFEYVKNEKAEIFNDVKEDLDFVISDLSETLSAVNTIDALAELDEEAIGLVFEYLEEYSDAFVISADEIQREKDLKEHEKIEELLALFYDDDEDGDEDEEFDEE